MAARTESEFPVDIQFDRVWDVVALIGSVLGGILVYGLFIHHGTAPSVIGYNEASAERLLHGQVPYRDFIYNYTPGLLWLNAAVFRLFGVFAINARMAVFVSRTVALGLVYLVARCYLPKWTALLPVAACLAWVGYGDILKTFPTQYGMCFLLGAWLLLLRSEDQSSLVAARIQLMLAGIMTGAVFVMKQNVGFFTLAALLISIFASSIAGRRFETVKQGPATGDGDKSTGQTFGRALARLVLPLCGFAVVAGLMLVILLKQHALQPMISHFLHHAVAYEEEKEISLPGVRALIPSLVCIVSIAAGGLYISRKKPGLTVWYSGFVVLAVLAVVAAESIYPVLVLYYSLVAQVYYLPIYTALAGIVLIAFLWKSKSPILRTSRMFSMIAFPLAAFLENFPRADADHLVRALPPTFIALSAIIVIGSQALSGRRASNRADFSVTVLASVTAIIVVLGLAVTWRPQFESGLRFSQNTPLTFARGEGLRSFADEAETLNRLVSYIDSNTQPGTPILVMARGLTGLYFFSDRPNITPMPWLDAPGISRQSREDVLNGIKQKKFALIVLGRGFSMKGVLPPRAPGEESDSRLKVLQPWYHPVEKVGGTHILLPNNENASVNVR